MSEQPTNQWNMTTEPSDMMKINTPMPITVASNPSNQMEVTDADSFSYDGYQAVSYTHLLEIARNMQMNIKTERKEDDLWGTIEMSFNNMWFLDSAPSEWKDIWNNLMKEAQRVYIEAKDNMVMYQYYYDLAVEVPCV